MSFHLPTADHKARTMFDMESLVEILDPRNADKLVCFREAICKARRTIAESNGAINRVVTVCIRADDERWLISVGARGGWRKEWNFGTGGN